MLGEDICDPYGGAFKVTKNISKDFPERIINTPISEAGFIGIGVGLAMNGIKPIIEIMFGDFISLGFDQILNHAVKYNDIYNGQVNVPLLIRIPSGGGRGYGATHSQSLEKFFVGIPHLNIIAFSLLFISYILPYFISGFIFIISVILFAELNALVYIIIRFDKTITAFVI